MIKKIITCCFLLLAILQCSKQEGTIVKFDPEHPRAGDVVSIKYEPKMLAETNQQNLSINVICEIYGRDGEIIKSKPMQKKNNSWKTSIETEPHQYLVRLKFEDNLGRVEDNLGMGWNQMLYGDNKKVRENTYYQVGVNYLNRANAFGKPEYKNAMKHFEEEISLFPENYNAWFELWYTKLKMTNNVAKQRKQIVSSMDSLLEVNSSNVELKLLIFNTAWKLLNDHEKAIQIGEQILAEAKEPAIKNEVKYSLIFIENREHPLQMIEDLHKFCRKINDKEYLKEAYYMLARSFQQFGEPDSSMLYYEKYLKCEPNDISVMLTVASHYLKNGWVDKATQMLKRARSVNEKEYYLNNFTWQRPAQRMAKQNLDRCQILSTEAKLNYQLKNYRKSIANRKKCIELATPFPAYEWQRIGDSYLEMGKVDSAKKAYLKSIGLNEMQSGAINKLKSIYQQEQNNLVGFDEYLEDAVQHELKANAIKAPDFELEDVQGNRFRLSDQLGKVVVLTFWDSWSRACHQEIPQLNKLVNMFDKSEVAFCAISVEAPVSLNRFLKNTEFNFRQLHSGYSVKKMFSVIGVPTHIIIDKNGKVRFKQVGFTNNIKETLQKQIKFLLKEERESLS